MIGGKIGHIARNCPMNEGGFGGFNNQGGYGDSAKTCYACGGFGLPFFK
jgi:Zinc knuckle